MRRGGKCRHCRPARSSIGNGSRGNDPAAEGVQANDPRPAPAERRVGVVPTSAIPRHDTIEAGSFDDTTAAPAGYSSAIAATAAITAAAAIPAAAAAIAATAAAIAATAAAIAATAAIGFDLFIGVVILRQLHPRVPDPVAGIHEGISAGFLNRDGHGESQRGCQRRELL